MPSELIHFRPLRFLFLKFSRKISARFHIKLLSLAEGKKHLTQGDMDSELSDLFSLPALNPPSLLLLLLLLLFFSFLLLLLLLSSSSPFLSSH